MNIESIELAAVLFFKMIETHPEICPHDYTWRYTQQQKDGRRTARYECRFCHKFFDKELKENENF